MTCPSPEFLVFAAVVIALFQIGRASWWHQAILLVANLYFLSTFSHAPLTFVPYAGFLALGYVGVRLQQHGTSSALKTVLIAATLLAFIWLKRYSFLPTDSFLPFPYVLLGLSYVFFRVMHLIIDAGSGALPDRIGVISYLNYTLNFTCITSGPIQRYQDHVRTEQSPAPLTWEAAGVAVERIVVGYFKVAIVSVALAALQQQAIAALSPDQAFLPRMGTAMAIAMIYPLYLYCNFSGYTDFVIGVARFLGQELPENFNRPFSSANFLDFWSRWHITLSSWLKTYVYNPLLMALMGRFSGRIEPFLGVFAFFVTFFLVGVWHGQTSVFVAFGFLQGFGVAANKLYQIEMVRIIGRPRYRALCANAVYAASCRGLTIVWFAFTLFWFWSNWAQMGQIASATGPAAIVAGWLCLLVLTTIVLAAWQAIRSGGLAVRILGEPVLLSRYTRTMWNTALVVVAVGVIFLLNQPAPDIVYKAF